MVWRPSRETRLMGWTVPQGRRRPCPRHRPHLEQLDDRCLLSTGLGTRTAHPLAVEVRDHSPRLVRLSDEKGSHAKAVRHAARNHAGSAKTREFPAGTIAA